MIVIGKKLSFWAAALAVLFSSVFAVVPLTSAADSANDAKDAVCEGIGAATGSTGCNDPDGSSNLSGTVSAAINIISLAVAVIAVIMVIVGGLKYITSQGESSGTASAKNTIIYAIVGLVVVALAQVIVRFVVNRVTPPEGSQQTSNSQPTQPAIPASQR